MTLLDWLPMPVDASPALEVFGSLLIGVALLRLFRFVLRVVGMGT